MPEGMQIDEAEGPDTLRGKRVMICEDEGIVQMHLDKVLRRHGVAIVGTTRFGDVCAETVVQARPDIVLMDISLEGTDGWEASRQILERCSPCIILITGQPRREVEARFREIPIHGYISKPVAGDELLRKMRECYAEHVRVRGEARN
jgi:two-component system, response regulator PdtaR